MCEATRVVVAVFETRESTKTYWESTEARWDTEEGERSGIWTKSVAHRSQS